MKYQAIRFYKILRHLNYVCYDEYENYRKKMMIRCDKGHVYLRTAQSILKGRKCKYCQGGGFNLNKSAYIYKLISECGRYEKIGVTNNLEKRLARLKKVTPFPFSLKNAQFFEDGKMVWELEKNMKNTFVSPFTDKFEGYSEWREI